MKPATHAGPHVGADGDLDILTDAMYINDGSGSYSSNGMSLDPYQGKRLGDVDGGMPDSRPEAPDW